MTDSLYRCRTCGCIRLFENTGDEGPVIRILNCDRCHLKTEHSCIEQHVLSLTPDTQPTTSIGFHYPNTGGPNMIMHVREGGTSIIAKLDKASACRLASFILNAIPLLRWNDDSEADE